MYVEYHLFNTTIKEYEFLPFFIEKEEQDTFVHFKTERHTYTLFSHSVYGCLNWTTFLFY